jgi:dTDP-glucose 4,6-dehydratase/UDP-glucuronate decarboxylase
MVETVLITGSTGIVGTHLLYRYAERDDVNVTAIYRSGIPSHLAGLSKHYPRIKFLRVDLTDSFNLFDLGMYDTIIHAATYGQPGKFMDALEDTVMLNTSITQYLFENCLNDNGRLLFVSTSEVYSGATPPYREDILGKTTPSHPRAGYIESKRCGEAIVNIYRRRFPESKSVRLSLAYGDGTRPNDKRVLNQFVQRGIQESEIKLMDDGASLRTYIYVGDAIDMIMNVLYGGKHEVYNIGGVSAVSICRLAELIGEMLGKPVVVGSGRGMTGAPQDTRMSISRYKNEFGLPDFIPLKEGLQKTIEYQKKLYETQDNGWRP